VGHHFRPAQEVALEVDKALIAGGHELRVVLHLFRQHAAAPGAVLFYQGSALLKRGEFQVYLEDVGHIGERLAGIVADVVIECDQVSSFFEALAGSNDLGVDGNGL